MRRVRSSPSFFSNKSGLATASAPGTAIDRFDREKPQRLTIISTAAVNTLQITFDFTSSPQRVVYSHQATNSREVGNTEAIQKRGYRKLMNHYRLLGLSKVADRT